MKNQNHTPPKSSPKGRTCSTTSLPLRGSWRGCFLLLLSLPFGESRRGMAQNIGINTTGAAATGSALLDLNTGNAFANPNGKGLLVPNVALTGTGSANPVTSPATSLLVYNTATVSDVTPGYYYWDGAAWVRFSTGAGGGGSGWLLTGNAGLVDATNFLGTTAAAGDKHLNFRVNNIKAGRIENNNSAGNVFFGYAAGNASANNGINTAIGSTALNRNTTGTGNVAVGVQALYWNLAGINNVGIGWNALFYNTADNNTAIGTEALNSNTTPSGNTAIGAYALWKNTTGYANLAIGYNALANNIQATKNIAIGYEALYAQSFGAFFEEHNNIAIGYHALYANQPTSSLNGLENIAIGSDALSTNTTGYSNTAVGQKALVNNTTGFFNTAIGQEAQRDNSTGNYNTAIGRWALRDNTGSNNTAIGYLANVSAGSNATAIGNGATVNASNKVRIGNASVGVIEGQVAYTSPSDARFKENVKEDIKGVDFIMKLHPVSYNFDRLSFAKHIKENTEGREKELRQLSQIRSVGFLAQDIEKIIKETGFEAFDAVHVPANENDNYSLSYSQFVVPLVKAVQEQQKIIENQQQAINKLQSENENLKTEFDSMLKKLEGPSGIRKTK
ncbi:MAG: hypothetical protein EPN85_12820 [Bacteroidetes bacterium]|nr:MAG: hypothetical protein EPN85_12820 [Bacteroidota bacterium]